MNSEKLAQSLKTNPTFVRRVMTRLAAAGLVKARRGKSGGVELARCPDEITLREIYLASQARPLLDRAMKSPEETCPVSCAMARIIDQVFCGIEDSVVDHLSEIKLAHLVKQVQDTH